jgi:carboxyl-terminal processing protease
VYGGGGIMPDIFVPIDTMGSSYYFGKLNYQGVFFQFGFQYVDGKRDDLTKEFSASNFAERFSVTNSLLQEFYDFAEDKGVPYEADGAKISEELIKRRIKATIARNLYREKVFYQVINQDDIVVKKAVEKLKN